MVYLGKKCLTNNNKKTKKISCSEQMCINRWYFKNKCLTRNGGGGGERKYYMIIGGKINDIVNDNNYNNNIVEYMIFVSVYINKMCLIVIH